MSRFEIITSDLTKKIKSSLFKGGKIEILDKDGKAVAVSQIDCVMNKPVIDQVLVHHRIRLTDKFNFSYVVNKLPCGKYLIAEE